MKKIDLHIHTNMSDGEFSSKEIIDMAVKNDIRVISITDHDSIDAYNEELFDYAKLKNIKIIPGVEISTKFNGAGIHVLGYNFNIDNKELKDKLFTLRNARHKYLYDVTSKLQELGFSLNFEELDKIDAVTKAHIARDIINNPNNKNVLLERFNHIPSMGEFIETIMNEGCPAYVKKDTISPKEAALLIKSAGGKVIMAHPIAYCYEDGLKEKDILTIINVMNADGIESNYIYISRDNVKINDSDKWNEIAKEYNLITTIGSDFHNIDGIHPDIGLINEDLNLDNEEIDMIIKNLVS